jgi:hypothetical protein
MRSIGTSQFGWPVGSLPPPDYINAAVLAANSPYTQAVPANASFVLISASQSVDIIVLFSGASDGKGYPANTAAAANFATVANTANGTTLGELNPLLRQLGGATYVSITANASCIVTLSYFN